MKDGEWGRWPIKVCTREELLEMYPMKEKTTNRRDELAREYAEKQIRLMTKGWPEPIEIKPELLKGIARTYSDGWDACLDQVLAELRSEKQALNMWTHGFNGVAVADWLSSRLKSHDTRTGGTE